MIICRDCLISKGSCEYYITNKSTGQLRSECKSCSKIRNLPSRIKNRKKASDQKKIYRIENVEKIRESNRLYNINNRDKIKIYQRKHLKENPEYYRNRSAQRRYKSTRATIYQHQKQEIRLFYKNCPLGYHVDHIIPLKGSTVSGLHCLENLQYLPSMENLKKGNKF